MGKEIHICPRCGSTNLGPMLGVGKYNARPNVYECKDCMYNGVCPLIDEDNVQAFKENLKNQ